LVVLFVVLVGVTAAIGWPVGRSIRWRGAPALAFAVVLTALFSLATAVSIRGIIGIGFLTLWPSAFLLGLSIGWAFESLRSVTRRHSRIKA
jgi:hypothetical protein